MIRFGNVGFILIKLGKTLIWGYFNIRPKGMLNLGIFRGVFYILINSDVLIPNISLAIVLKTYPKEHQMNNIDGGQG